MKLNYLKINGYKNLEGGTIFNDIENCENYLALVGLNGSGKSNVLEAVSIVFASLHKDETTDFDYEIHYTLNENAISIINGNIKNNGKSVLKKDIKSHLPKQVIACYSGEELRLWEEVYEDFYIDFFNHLKNQTDFVPKLLYLNKYAWDIALIALMCSDDEQVLSFLKDNLKIEIKPDIEIEFSLDFSNENNYTDNEALSFLRRIREEIGGEDGRISINTIRTFDLGQTDNTDFVKKIFYYLFVCFIPAKSEKIKIDKIIKSMKVHFDGLNTKLISEGEKKLLLIKCITEILGSEECLYLFDEPDAHLHISRKKEIINFIDKPNHFSILTTHSPSLINCSKENNIRIVNNGEDGIEIISVDKIQSLERITEGEFTLMDATLVASTSRDIMLVEGKNDYNYLTKALEVLKRTKSPKYDDIELLIINCGGAGNVPAVLRQSIIPYLKDSQLCIPTFDDDKPGIDGVNAVERIINDTSLNNIKVMTHPRISNWPHDTQFFMEDYFPITAYKHLCEAEINNAANFNSLSSIKTPKKIIADNYQNFDDSDFNNFEVFFDEIIRLEKEFRKV